MRDNAMAEPRGYEDEARVERPGQPEFERAESEDDDGYDPYSDRMPAAEPLFERDPWA